MLWNSSSANYIGPLPVLHSQRAARKRIQATADLRISQQVMMLEFEGWRALESGSIMVDLLLSSQPVSIT